MFFFYLLLNSSGHPLAQSEGDSQCFERLLNLTCYHDETTYQTVWLLDGTQVERDENDNTILLKLSRLRFALKKAFIQCCVKVRNKQICGEPFPIEPLGKVHVLWHRS